MDSEHSKARLEAEVLLAAADIGGRLSEVGSRALGVGTLDPYSEHSKAHRVVELLADIRVPIVDSRGQSEVGTLDPSEVEYTPQELLADCRVPIADSRGDARMLKLEAVLADCRQPIAEELLAPIAEVRPGLQSKEL